MDVAYTTVTAKGQITLPAGIRRALHLDAGRKVEVRLEGETVVIEAAPEIGELRARLRAEAEANGTWGLVPSSGDGWTAHVRSTHAQS
jgi:AbrB family looped-hinge helix DNA binding protein